MIDYLNPSRISANPPEGTEPFCGVNCNELQQNCTTKSTKTAPQRENAEIRKNYSLRRLYRYRPGLYR
jgi:hypothetical protein